MFLVLHLVTYHMLNNVPWNMVWENATTDNKRTTHYVSFQRLKDDQIFKNY